MMLGSLRQDTADAESARISVLVTDDDPTQRMLVGAALEHMETVDAENGLVAVNTLTKRHFDLAIVDLDMPVMDGFGVIERVRARPETRHLPIIVVTGRDDVLAIERAFALGATSFLCKPINWNVFRHQVGYVLRTAERERELRIAKERAERQSLLHSRGLAALARELGGREGRLENGSDAPGDAAVCARPAETEDVTARSRALLRRLARASQILTGEVQVSPKPVRSRDVIATALEKVEAALGPHAEDRIQVADDGATSLTCDPGLAAEALAEVLKNAVLALALNATVHIRVVDAPPERVRFEIQDSGSGIPEHMIHNGLPLPAGAAKGAGLGLVMAKAITDLHDGHFGLVSEPGQGTEVFLSFRRG